jgi:hypothetical protein
MSKKPFETIGRGTFALIAVLSLHGAICPAPR